MGSRQSAKLLLSPFDSDTVLHFMKKLVLIGFWCIWLTVGFTRESLVGVIKDFSSATYFESPHEQQIKMRITGAEVIPNSDLLFDIRQLKIEQFNVDGKVEMTVEAPQCFYAYDTGIVNSDGHIKMGLKGGLLQIEGDGFYWNQTNGSCVISNKVHTIIKI